MGKPIVVFGSFIVDVTSRSSGLPVPGQTLRGSSFKTGPGGKGSNQAVAAKRAGADVTMVTKIGSDSFAGIALDFYAKEGMSTEYMFRDPKNSTGVALIMVDEVSGQNQIVVVSGACGNITIDEVENCRRLIESAGILLVQLETNFDALFHCIDIAYAAGVPIVLNPAPAAAIPDAVMAKINTVTPNETEAGFFTGIEVRNKQDAEKAAQVFLDKGVKNVVITMGSLGAFATDGVRSELLPRLAVDAVDTTGAGDAFNGGFVKALADGCDLFTALRWGNATGALSVTKHGSSPAMPEKEAIEKIFRENYGE